MQDRDEKFMLQCIRLALKGAGKVSPNPLVGCVIVKEGKIIGRGYHKRFGDAHAEVNAVSDAHARGYDIGGADVYVNLEPCSHIGRTGSCARLLAKLRPASVKIGTKDPFSKVNGKGIRILRDAGIKVSVGIAENMCREVNRFFLTFVRKKRPYVTLKVAQSLDGRIALQNRQSKYITSEESRRFVHEMRTHYDAVLIGSETARIDDPSLDSRMTGGRCPGRYVIDPELELEPGLKIFSDINKDRSTVLFRSGAKVSDEYAKVRRVPVRSGKTGISTGKILESLYLDDISSVLVEGGSRVFSDFLRSGIYDDIVVFIAPKILGSGISAFDGIKIDNLTKAENLIPAEIKITNAGELILRYKNVHGNC